MLGQETYDAVFPSAIFVYLILRLPPLKLIIIAEVEKIWVVDENL